MIQIYDANAYLRSELHRQDGVAHLSPRLMYERINIATVPQVFVWDGPGNNDRRREIFPGYKRRDYTGQENIFAGLKIYRELLDLSKAIQIEVPGYEADDVCSTLAWRYASQGQPVQIFTNDFDYYQLTQHPLITLKGVSLTAGVLPKYVSLYKALRGDTSDKIPGLPGFGHKTWLSMAALYEPMDLAMKQRDREALRAFPWKPKAKLWLSEDENVDQIFDFYQITQMYNVPMDLINEHTKPGVFNPVGAMQIFTRFML